MQLGREIYVHSHDALSPNQDTFHQLSHRSNGAGCAGIRDWVVLNQALQQPASNISRYSCYRVVYKPINSNHAVLSSSNASWPVHSSARHSYEWPHASMMRLAWVRGGFIVHHVNSESSKS
jgi:hypothetical protein